MSILLLIIYYPNFQFYLFLDLNNNRIYTEFEKIYNYLDTLDISRLINMQDMFKDSAVSKIIARTSADANKICTEANATGAYNTSVISVYVQNTKICEFDCEQEAMH